MKRLLLCTLFSLAVISGHAQDYRLSSPDGSLRAEISIGAAASLELSRGAEHLLNLQDLDLVSGNEQLKGMRSLKTASQSVSQRLSPAIREKSASYLDHYNELTIYFKSDKALTLRLYNEGLAYRFETSAKDSLSISHEGLTIRFQEDD